MNGISSKAATSSFGLTMAGISSKAATTLENKYKFPSQQRLPKDAVED
jgi:hypothetical protein